MGEGGIQPRGATVLFKSQMDHRMNLSTKMRVLLRRPLLLKSLIIFTRLDTRRLNNYQTASRGEILGNQGEEETKDGDT